MALHLWLIEVWYYSHKAPERVLGVGNMLHLLNFKSNKNHINDVGKWKFTTKLGYFGCASGCGHGEAVSFQETARGEEGMTSFFRLLQPKLWSSMTRDRDLIELGTQVKDRNFLWSIETTRNVDSNDQIG
ncbi:hypothetical protein Tco_0323377 [Tanacetum coccineum]